MDVARDLVAVELAVTVLVAVLLSLSRWQAGMRALWREEAEAQAARGDRLEEQVEALSEEVRLLRAENSALQLQIAELLGRPA